MKGWEGDGKDETLLILSKTKALRSKNGVAASKRAVAGWRARQGRTSSAGGAWSRGDREGSRWGWLWTVGEEETATSATKRERESETRNEKREPEADSVPHGLAYASQEGNRA